MGYKKRAGLIVVLSLFLLLFIPNVFALLESFYPLLYGPTDLVQLYQQWQSWADFIIFFLIFASAARIGYSRIYGEHGKEPAGATGLYVGIGLFSSVGLVLLFRQYGWSLLNFGPLILIVLVLMFMLLMYQLLLKKDAVSLWPALAFLILTLLIASALFPNLIPFQFPPGILFLLILAGLVALLLWLGGLAFGGAGAAGGAGGAAGGATPVRDALAERAARIIEPGPREPVTPGLFAVILIRPAPVSRDGYVLGDSINLTARLTRRGWRPWNIFSAAPEALGRFHFTWHVGGVEVNTDPRNHEQTISYTLPQTLLTQIRQRVIISVLVQDLDTPTTRATANLDIYVNAPTPLLRIVQPVDTVTGVRTLTVPLGAVLPFEYAFDARRSALALADARWLYLAGNVPVLNRATLGRATAIREGNNFNLTVGTAPFNLAPGVYTIICAGIDATGNYLEIPILRTMLADSFVLTVGTAPVGPAPELLLHVYDQVRPTRRDVPRSPFDSMGPHPLINAVANSSYYFQAEVRSGNLADYTIAILHPLTAPDQFRPVNASAVFRPMSAGLKTFTCRFTRNADGVVTEVNVAMNVVAAPSLLQIEVIAPSTRAATFGATPQVGVLVPHDTPLPVEARILRDSSGQITNILWSMKPLAGGIDLVQLTTSTTATWLGFGNSTNVIVPTTILPGRYFLAAIAVGTDASGSPQPLDAFDFILIDVTPATGGPYGPYGGGPYGGGAGAGGGPYGGGAGAGGGPGAGGAGAGGGPYGGGAGAGGGPGVGAGGGGAAGGTGGAVSLGIAILDAAGNPLRAPVTTNTTLNWKVNEAIRFMALHPARYTRTWAATSIDPSDVLRPHAFQNKQNISFTPRAIGIKRLTCTFRDTTGVNPPQSIIIELNVQP